MLIKLPSSQSSSECLGTTKTINPTTDNDDDTLKPMDFKDFKRSIHQEYVNGRNINEDTLKKNQPIHPSRINDSLKLFGENAISNSFNCEQALRSIDPLMINDTLCRRVVSGVEGWTFIGKKLCSAEVGFGYFEPPSKRLIGGFWERSKSFKVGTDLFSIFDFEASKAIDH